jgi:hypothetical protein
VEVGEGGGRENRTHEGNEMSDIDWQKWLMEERAKYVDTSRDHVARQRALMVWRITPLVTQPLPPIIYDPNRLHVQPLKRQPLRRQEAINDLSRL